MLFCLGSMLNFYLFLRGWIPLLKFAQLSWDCTSVSQNALGGLLVAVVVKYADNILKVSFESGTSPIC